MRFPPSTRCASRRLLHRGNDRQPVLDEIFLRFETHAERLAERVRLFRATRCESFIVTISGVASVGNSLPSRSVLAAARRTTHVLSPRCANAPSEQARRRQMRLAVRFKSEARSKIEIDALIVRFSEPIAHVERTDRRIESQKHASRKNRVLERGIVGGLPHVAQLEAGAGERTKQLYVEKIGACRPTVASPKFCPVSSSSLNPERRRKPPS